MILSTEESLRYYNRSKVNASDLQTRLNEFTEFAKIEKYEIMISQCQETRDFRLSLVSPCVAVRSLNLHECFGLIYVLQERAKQSKIAHEVHWPSFHLPVAGHTSVKGAYQSFASEMKANMTGMRAM